MNNDSFQFFPKDWLSDEKLSMCRLATKGAWIDLLCYMHQGDPYGYLVINGKILTRDDIQKMLKVSEQKHFDIIWNELINYGILRKSSKGAYYSSRLLKEKKKMSLSLDDIKKSEFYSIYKDVIEHLNKVSGKKYIDDAEDFMLVLGLFQKGYSLDDFKKVNEMKYEDWKDDKKMFGFYRPRTLYGQKFVDYLNQNPKYVLEKEKKAATPMQSYFLNK